MMSVDKLTFISKMKELIELELSLIRELEEQKPVNTAKLRVAHPCPVCGLMDDCKCEAVM